MEKNFKFFMPLEVLEKAYDKNGREVMKIGGIASTSEKDTDGEYLDPNGFDLSYFLNQGFLNYHHQAKNNPNAIIGEPTKAEIRKEGLYIEGFLYPDSELARSIYDTALMLEKNSDKRRLGFSIEGTATKRKNPDPKHPDFKYVEKAAISGCAITFSPKNPKTFMDLIKGGIDDDYNEVPEDEKEIEKMLSAGSTTGLETKHSTTSSGAPLKLESMSADKNSLKNVVPATTVIKEDEKEEEKSQVLTKSQAVNYIFDKYSDINLNIAEKLCNFIFKSMAKDKTEITGSELEKALEQVEKAIPTKEVEGSTEEKEETPAEEAAEKKSKKSAKKEPVMEKAKEVEEKEEDEKEEEMEKSTVAETMSKITKGLEDVQELIKDKNYSVGVILKGIYDNQTSLSDRIEALEKGLASGDLNKAVQSDELNKGVSNDLTKAIEIFSSVSSKIETLSDKIESIEKALDAPQPRKSAVSTRGIDRRFVGQDEIEKAQSEGRVLSLHDNKKGVLELLDKCAFEKGYDNEFAEAMLAVENGAGIPARVVARLQSERGITIV